MALSKIHFPEMFCTEIELGHRIKANSLERSPVQAEAQQGAVVYVKIRNVMPISRFH